MGAVYAVDLGKWVSGLAVFVDDRLAWAGEVRITRRLSRPSANLAIRMAAALWGEASAWPLEGLWVAERMRDYAGKGGRSADLQHLREVSQRLSEVVREHGARFRDIPAERWKGMLPKDVCHRRTLRFLDDDEQSNIVLSSKESLDAIGIGLHTLGRAGRGMTRPKDSLGGPRL